MGKINFGNFFKICVVFLMITSWVFGYPPVYENFWRARILDFPPKIQEAEATNETLYVDGFNSVNEQWTETGDSPWLNDNTANEIYTKTDEYGHEEFTFANSGVGSGTINSVHLYMELKILDTGRNDSVEIYIHDGTSWSVKLSDWNPSSTSYYWENVAISTTIDSWAKIDATKLKIKYDKSGSPSTAYIYVRRAYLYIDYSLISTTFLIGGTESGTKDTSVTTITFPEGAPESTISVPYNDVDGSGDPQVLSATVSEPVVKIKNTHASASYNVVLEITTWTNSVVSMEYYNLAADGATDINTVTAELSNANGAARTVSTGVSIAAAAYKDLYLKLTLGSVAGKTGTSTLTILGETP